MTSNKKSGPETGRSLSYEEVVHLEDRFKKYVLVSSNDDCWIWTGLKDGVGYGSFRLNKRMVKAHRFALALSGVDVPVNMLVMHTCDNPSCVNPKHLLLGTQLQNIRDSISKGRAKKATGDKNGARKYPEKYRGENSSQAKLSNSDILEIRKKAAAKESFVSLSETFGVSIQNIRHIVNGETWKHLL